MKENGRKTAGHFAMPLGCSVKPDYQKARALDTPEAYEAFLDKHPEDKEYSPKARKHLERLSFEEAQKKDTFAGYTQFLKKYPVEI